MCKDNNENEYINYQTGEVLDLSRVNSLPDNAMIKVRPELWIEWDFEKNDELEYDIWKMTKGSHKNAWWICYFEHSNCSRIGHRCDGQNCRNCRKNRPTKTEESLSYKNPELASQWHPTKNGKLTPYDVYAYSNQKVWWLGECGHEWNAMINGRNGKGSGCPYCSGHRLLVGFNDMWTTNPELASLLANPEDGHKYMTNSGAKLNWKCPDCGEIINGKYPHEILKRTLKCPKCSDNKSIGEKTIATLLDLLRITYYNDLTFDWSDRKRYDFYLPSFPIIIESHGEQHYSKSNFKDARTLKEEQENDKYKYELAIANGISPENYIIIDCRKSDFEFIKNNILNSRLAEIFDLSDIDWNELFYLICKSLHIKILELWKNGYIRKEIAEITKLHNQTVHNILKKFEKLGRCIYTGVTPKPIVNNKQVIQLSLEGELLEEFISMAEAKRRTGMSLWGIRECCLGNKKSYKNYIWKFK